MLAFARLFGCAAPHHVRPLVWALAVAALSVAAVLMPVAVPAVLAAGVDVQAVVHCLLPHALHELAFVCRR